MVAGSGIDVWEVARAYLACGEDLETLAEALPQLARRQIEAAIYYYRCYPREIDERLAGEQINPRVAVELRELTHDVLAAQEAGTRGASDSEQLDAASSDRRGLVTYNIADFHALLVEWAHTGRPHWGIIFVSERSIPQRSVGALVSALDRLLKDLSPEDALLNQALYLTKG